MNDIFEKFDQLSEEEKVLVITAMEGLLEDG